MTINITISIADRYAAAKAAFDDAKAALDAIKAEVKEIGAPTLHGVSCDITLNLSEQMRFSEKLAKEFLTDDQIAKCKTPILVETIRVKAKGIAC